MFFKITHSIAVLCFVKVILNENTDCGCGVNRSKDPNIQGSCSKKNKGFGSLIEDAVAIENELEYSTMIKIPSGKYQFGTNEIAIETDNEGPKTIVDIKSFYLDKFEVSNNDYMNFVKATKYKTEAELFGDSFVFALFLNDSVREQLKDFRVMQALWWYKVAGANWMSPYGPGSNIRDIPDHPVIHVSWTDAQAYCKWRNARLPTEAEWEAACRGGHNDTRYPWGDKLFPDHLHKANIWQGTFPKHNSMKDGFLGTNPVHLFPQNDFGLHNMAGNVWEWVEDSWSTEDPKEKVKKGGSYLCHRSYCYRYRCSARSHNTKDSSAGNLGFRCAKTI